MVTRVLSQNSFIRLGNNFALHDFLYDIFAQNIIHDTVWHARVSSVYKIVTREGGNLQDLTGIEFCNLNARGHNMADGRLSTYLFFVPKPQQKTTFFHKNLRTNNNGKQKIFLHSIIINY